MTDRTIVEAAARLRRQGEPHLIATVVGAPGDAYRTPGARLLLTRFRWIAGTVSGGCLEGDLASSAWTCTTDRPVVRRFTSEDVRDPDIRSAFGLGGDDAIDVLLERGADRPGTLDALEVAARCLQRGRAGAVATVIRSDEAEVPVGARLACVAGGPLEQERGGLDPLVRELVGADLRAALATGETTTRTYDTPFGAVEVFLEAFLPPPRLFLFGTGLDAVPVAQLARTLGWDVVVCAPEPRHATRDRFSMAHDIAVGEPTALAARLAGCERAVAVVMNHELERDRACVAALLGTPARYIGVLGARAVLGEVLDPRVGTARTGETPQELALALLGDALAAVGRPRWRPVHDRGGGTTLAVAAARAR